MPEMTIIKPGYKKTAVGVIPEDWDCLKIKDVLKDSFLGGNYNNTLEKEFCSEKIPLIKMGNIDRGKIDIKTFYSIDDDVQIDEKHRLNKGDVLFNTRNTLELVGKVAIWNNEYPLAYFNSNLLKLVFQKNKVINSFANLTLNSQKGLRQLKSVATGTTSVAAIYDRDLRNLKLPIPPLPEQKAIADCLSTWDKAIEKQTQLIEAKKEFKKGLMQGFFSGQLTVENGQIIKAKEEEDFTEDWEEVKFKNIFKQKKEKACKDGQNLEVLSVTKIGIVSQESYFNKAVASDDKTDYLIIKKYDFVLSGLNFWMGSYDILRNFDIGIISPAYKTYSVFSSFNIEFIYNLIKTDDFKKAMIASSVQGASIVRRNLDSDIMKNWLFKIPKIKLQFAIAQVLQSTDKEIELQEKKLVQLQLQKKGLMQVLLTGERRLVKE